MGSVQSRSLQGSANSKGNALGSVGGPAFRSSADHSDSGSLGSKEHWADHQKVTADTMLDYAPWEVQVHSVWSEPLEGVSTHYGAGLVGLDPVHMYVVLEVTRPATKQKELFFIESNEGGVTLTPCVDGKACRPGATASEMGRDKVGRTSTFGHLHPLVASWPAYHAVSNNCQHFCERLLALF